MPNPFRVVFEIAEVIDVEPNVIVVEPLITPDTTISLFGDVSKERNTAGFAALPVADQSLEFRNVSLLSGLWGKIRVSLFDKSSWSISGLAHINNKEAIIKTTITKLKGFVLGTADTMSTVS